MQGVVDPACDLGGTRVCIRSGVEEEVNLGGLLRLLAGDGVHRAHGLVRDAAAGFLWGVLGLPTKTNKLVGLAYCAVTEPKNTYNTVRCIISHTYAKRLRRSNRHAAAKTNTRQPHIGVR